jgi:hypothetical protein
MGAPELAALAILEHAIHVASLAMLAEHPELLDPDPPFRHEPEPGAHITTPFFARAHALSIVIRRYRTAITRAALAREAARDDACHSDHNDF